MNVQGAIGILDDAMLAPVALCSVMCSGTGVLKTTSGDRFTLIFGLPTFAVAAVA
jgi:hypothetical protein